MPSSTKRIDLSAPALLKFEGPDTIRFLNGQVTQDVQQVVDSGRALPACVTDHKGKLQFRVWLHPRGEAVWVEAPEGLSEALEARLTRYLIADDVEVSDLSGQWQLHHLTDLSSEGPALSLPEDAVTCPSRRFGSEGLDCWLPVDASLGAFDDIPLLEGDDLEALRIERAIPAWRRELTEGMLPPEAGLDTTDISYHKGCYIGQEVISRIKSAGKVNRRLTQLSFAASLPTDDLELVGEGGKTAGEITSISPNLQGELRLALGFIKRSAKGLKIRDSSGLEHAVHVDQA